MSELRGRLTSRKFLIAVAGIAYALVSEVLGTITPAEAIDAMRTVALAYIAAEGAADVVGRIGSSSSDGSARAARDVSPRDPGDASAGAP